MKTLVTRYFGAIEYDDESVVVFPDGIPGFEDQRGFLPVEQPATKPLLFLQSLAVPDLCFITLPVLAACPDYRLTIPADDLEALGLKTDRQPVIGQDVLCLAIISVGEDTIITANLLAPLVISLGTKLGRQPIMAEPEYSHRHPLEAETQEQVCS